MMRGYSITVEGVSILTAGKPFKEALTTEHHEVLRDVMGGLKDLYGDRLKQVILYGCKNRSDQGSDLDMLVVIEGMSDRSAEIRCIHQITSPITREKNILVTAIPVNRVDFESQREMTFFSDILRNGLML